MKNLINKILIKLYHRTKKSTFSGLIPIDSRTGFWKTRSAPTVSLLNAARIFNRIGGDTIVEIGSGIQGEMSGNSILVWSRETSAKKIFALDLDEKQVNDVKRATAEYPNVEALLTDGIQFVAQYKGKIDLLYLDFWTPDPEGAMKGIGRAEAYLKVYNIAKAKMEDYAMILIDDTDHVHPWKSTYIVPEARKDGFQVIWEGRQTLLIKLPPTNSTIDAFIHTLQLEI